MGGGKGKKQGGGAKDYYGSIAGAVCVGPVDELVALIADGKTIWPTAEDWKAGSYAEDALARHRGRIWRATAITTTEPGDVGAAWTTCTVARPDPVLIPFKLTVEGFGEAFFYWGTDDQELDPINEVVLSSKGHPPYRRQAFIVLKNFLFGRERTSAPNIEVVVRRKPVQSVIEGPAAELDEDGQANPFAVLAELLTHPVAGLGLSPDILEPDSWQVAADAMHAVRSLSYLSPVLTNAAPIRNIIAEVLPYFDGWLRWNHEGQIEAGRWAHNVAPPVLAAPWRLDPDDLVEPVQYDAGTLAETQNEVVVQFLDAMRAWKDALVRAINSHNRGIVGEPRAMNIDRPWVTRRIQAAALAVKALGILAQPSLRGTLQARAEKALLILPGDLFQLSHPDLGLDVLCRCMGKVLNPPPAGTVTIEYEAERAMIPVARAPVYQVDDEPQPPGPARVVNFAFLQLPPELADGEPYRLALLAARTTGATSELEVWMRQRDPTAWSELATLKTFALAGTVESSISALDVVDEVVTASTLVGDSYPLGSTDVWATVVKVGGAPMVLDTDYSIDVETGTVTILDGGAIADGSTLTASYASTVEITLATPTHSADVERLLTSQTDDEVADVNLLLVLIRAGFPDQFELFAVKSASAVGGGVYALFVRRARFNTLAGGDGAYNWQAGDRAFVIERAEVVQFQHKLFPYLAQQALPANFRLVPATTWKRADVADVYHAGTNPGGLTTEATHTFTDRYAPDAEWTAVAAAASPVTVWTVASASRERTANVATLVTGADHGLVSGDLVEVVGVGAADYDVDLATVTVIDPTTFTYPNTGADEANTADAGATVHRFVNAAGPVEVTAELRDSSGDLTEARFYARRGVEEVSADPAGWTFAGSLLEVRTASLALPEGDWRVFASLRDATRRTSRIELTGVGGGAGLPLRVRAAGSTTVANPLCEPIGGNYSLYPIVIVLTCSTPGATIEVQLRTLGLPVSSLLWVPYTGPITISKARSVYARGVKAGSVTSPILHEDFW